VGSWNFHYLLVSDSKCLAFTPHKWCKFICDILRERPDRGHGIPASVNTVGRQEPLRQGRTNLAIEESLFYKFMPLGRRNDNRRA
jgi:hypothetical protein